jgi:hypothetical protein
MATAIRRRDDRGIGGLSLSLPLRGRAGRAEFVSRLHQGDQVALRVDVQVLELRAAVAIDRYDRSMLARLTRSGMSAGLNCARFTRSGFTTRLSCRREPRN